MPIIVFTPETMKYMTVGALLVTGIIMSSLGINGIVDKLSDKSVADDAVLKTM